MDEQKNEQVKNDEFEVTELEDKELDDVSGGFLDWNCGCGNGSCGNEDEAAKVS